MNKENVFRTQEEITEEQKARISQKFRAAKALLARKRPYHVALISDHPNLKVPLTGVQSNVPSSVSLKFACFPTEISSVKRLSISGHIHLKDENKNGLSRVPSTDGFLPNSFVTPLRQSECTNLSGGFSLAADLDDEFDESVLQEIDALCEERSAKKSEQKDATRNDPSGGSRYNENDGVDTTSVECANANNVSENGGTLQVRDRLDGLAEGSGNIEVMSIAGFPKAYSDYLQSLNDQQKEAACTDISTPLMIVAGPGSGKTSTMVGRVLMLLNEGIGPSNILAMTFTTAAASEMRDRIGAVAGKDVAKQLTISTFHSFCLQLCRTYADKLGRTAEFLIYGHGQQRRAIIEAVRLLESKKITGENVDASKLDRYDDMSCGQYFKDKSKKWQKFVTQAKASGKTPAECRQAGDVIGAVILENYEGILRSCNALDYHDLISCSVTLLTDFPGVCEESQDLWKAMVIDEFQDTSAMQYTLLRILASHNRITIVGDEDQSIFSFNGADISGFDSFRKDFPNHTEIKLTKNYRSTRYIVEAAHISYPQQCKPLQDKASYNG